LHVARYPAISAHDADEMESHLRDQMDSLVAAGLDEDEAFLVAVRRLGKLDEVSREYAREHTERLWKQLVGSGQAESGRLRDLGPVVALAVLAAVMARLGVAVLSPEWAARDAVLLVLPFPTAYFLWKRRPPGAAVVGIVTAYVVTAVFLNAYPLGSQTGALQAGHAVALLWLVGLGGAYAGGQWRSAQRRMDLIRFTGEWAVYYALLALGGGVLMVLSYRAFSAAGVSIDTVISDWVLPGGAAGAVVVAAWLVEAKQSVVENMAPVLTRVFTPLTLVMLLAVLGAFVAGPGALDVGRDLLIVMDLLLALVLGLLLYALSARDRGEGPTWFDTLLLALVVAALLVDLVGGYAMVARIASSGWSANKATALGLNLVLLGNLVPSGWLLLSFLRRRRGVGVLERWQTSYLPVYVAWCLLVVVAVPPVFGFQ
jgi:hypothetical protein